MLCPQKGVNNIAESKGRIWLSKWIRPYESFWSVWQRYKMINVLSDSEATRDVIGKCPYNSVLYKRNIFTEASFYPGKTGLQYFGFSEKHFSEPLLENIAPEGYLSHSFLIEHALFYCPICMEKYNFHSFYHQLTGLKECPWHKGQPLMKSESLIYEISKHPTYAYGKSNPGDVFFDPDTNCSCAQMPEPELPILPSYVYPLTGFSENACLKGRWISPGSDAVIFAGSKNVVEKKMMALYNELKTIHGDLPESFSRALDYYKYETLIAYELWFFHRNLQGYDPDLVTEYEYKIGRGIDLEEDQKEAYDKRLEGCIRFYKEILHGCILTAHGSHLRMLYKNQSEMMNLCSYQGADKHLPMIVLKEICRYMLLSDIDTINLVNECIYAVVIEDVLDCYFTQFVNDPRVFKYKRLKLPVYLIMVNRDQSVTILREMT